MLYISTSSSKPFAAEIAVVHCKLPPVAVIHRAMQFTGAWPTHVARPPFSPLQPSRD